MTIKQYAPVIMYFKCFIRNILDEGGESNPDQLILWLYWINPYGQRAHQSAYTPIYKK